MSEYYTSYKELVDLFLGGATVGLSGANGRNRNLKIEGALLVHYDTTMAERSGSNIYINDTYYSLQSRKVQKILLENIPEEKQIIVKGVKRGYGKKLSNLVK